MEKTIDVAKKEIDKGQNIQENTPKSLLIIPENNFFTTWFYNQ